MELLFVIPMTNKVLLGAIMAITLIGGSIVAAEAAGVFSDIVKAKLNDGKKALNSLQIKTGAKIPTGTILHGFGIVTDGSAPGAAAAAIVTTSHPGVYDSEDQADADDPVWHNHVVALKGVSPATCSAGLAVLDLTFESPGTTNVQSNHVGMNHIPYGAYTGQIANTAIDSGDDAALIVSFTLSANATTGDICVTPVSSAAP